MPPPADSLKTSRFIMLMSVAVIIAALYLAQEILVPLALATLLSFLLTPSVHRLEKLKLPRAAAVLVTVAVAFGILGGIGYVVYNQLADLAPQLPTYRENIKTKVNSIRGGGILSSVKQAGDEVRSILSLPTSEPATQAAQKAEESPKEPAKEPSAASHQPADNGNPSESPLQLIEDLGGKVLSPLGTAFIVIVFTIFIMLQREDLRDRLIRLVGRSQLTVTTEAMDDAADRVSRYLIMQSIVNGGVGITVMVMLWAIGKLNGTPFPSPALFGMLSALLRFIPYVGIWVAASMPLLLSLAVYTSAGAAFETLGAFVAMEIIAANVLEPLLFGSSTGITTLGVLVAAAFWTWLWGPVGLILSTPMTVCLVVMGKYVPQLSFLSILLADEPPLPPPDRVYQRLLALDEEEAERLVDEYARQMPLEQLYDEVLVPALALAEQDWHLGNLDEDRHGKIRRGMREIVDELGERQRAHLTRQETQRVIDQAKEDAATASASGNGKSAPAPLMELSLAQPAPGDRPMLPRGCVVSILCLPAHDESDELAGLMLAQLLEFRGYCATVVSVDHLASEMIGKIEQLNADAVCVSALPPNAVHHARSILKRIQAKLPEHKLLVGIWTSKEDPRRAKLLLGSRGNVQLSPSLREALQLVHQIVQPSLVNQGQNGPPKVTSESVRAR